ncbi:MULTISPECIES: FAD-dependent oxidoreductase [unclassified Spirosoma]|mgnify:CR=1 FL=1|uniref:NAD(P)/FAD-dependent oxidoreductase n=1 Tax=unclassified Spirosoma TaxID=2621999 RepID=UPI000960769F|nr:MULTISPECIES: FAD-dependent oxidoreductase [unclassified Spirosoma]MBN8823857.1 FAD-dependent oxidoreductase [Spirosoma sp.]OJW79751.1 MAG: amino acid dehydrogenase [Spirosoma sp. 48-14]
MAHIGVIGGGIIGLCSAYYLHKAGHTVTLFEQAHIANGCSFGNAGMIVPSHIVPLAQPGMIAKGLRWMLKSTSPFYVKPRLDAELMRWGWLFYKHSTPEHVERSIPVLRDLSFLSKRLYQDLANRDGFSFGWQERGLFMLYKTAAAEHEMAEEAEIANRAGVEAQLLNGKQVQELEPHVRVTVQGAVYYPGDAHLNPNELMLALVDYLRQEGVTILENHPVTGFGTSGARITTVHARGSFEVDEVVIAGGAWSPGIARQLGLSLPLQGGKGYSFMLPGTVNDIQIPAIMLEARATATPIGGNLRFAGTLEVAGTDMSVNMNRVRGIAESINQYYPDIRVDMPVADSIWRGLRPCSPDGLPYIGRTEHCDNVVLATGHGMMGVSLGPATGKLVSELISHSPQSMELTAFNPNRFA